MFTFYLDIAKGVSPEKLLVIIYFSLLSSKLTHKNRKQRTEVVPLPILSIRLWLPQLRLDEGMGGKDTPFSSGVAPKWH